MPVTKYACEGHILPQDLHFILLNTVASDTLKNKMIYNSITNHS